MKTNKPVKLRVAEVRALLADLPGAWTLTAGKLHREYKFADFKKAFSFMKAAAPAIEKMNHHPEWFNVYNSVVVDLATHDAKGITLKDFELARVLEAAAAKRLR